MQRLLREGHDEVSIIGEMFDCMPFFKMLLDSGQDINQLKSRETGYGPDETITSNCHIQTAFPPNRLDTAEHLSKLTGQTTTIKEQVTRLG